MAKDTASTSLAAQGPQMLNLHPHCYTVHGWYLLPSNTIPRYTTYRILCVYTDGVSVAQRYQSYACRDCGTYCMAAVIFSEGVWQASAVLMTCVVVLRRMAAV